jgi:hypothetical protein
MGPKGALDGASFARCHFGQIFLSKGAGSWAKKDFFFLFLFFSLKA